ncbi:response regulator [Chloroflexota bacterium]
MNAEADGDSGRAIPRMRVLIADDVRETRRGTRLMLALNPTVKIVAIAHNGMEAVELAKKHKPEIAIMDINMPEMDGISAIRAMRQQNPELCCIVISVERETYIYDEAMEAGACAYLVKPFTVDELNEAVERASQEVMSSRSRNLALVDLAQEYIEARRSDDQAVSIFEQLAANPACELRWLVSLGIIYMLRGEWGKLKALAERLETEQN